MLKKVILIFLLGGLLLFSFLSGQLLQKRQGMADVIVKSYNQVEVTEILLEGYLETCDRTGFRRFITFHEHNVSRVLREINYSKGHPLFLNQTFIDEMQGIYLPYVKKHEFLRSEFIQNCDKV